MSIRLTGIAVLLAIFLSAPVVSAFDSDEDSMISRNWGKSFQAQKKAQIANPEAGKVTGPIEGFEGRAAEKTMDAYHDSFSQQNAREGYTFDSIGVMVGGQ
jgi:type III secretory pathway component EscR